MTEALLKFVTDFGDTALLLSCVLIAVLYLVRAGRTRYALILTGTVLTAAAVIGFLKAVAFACQVSLLGFPVHAPSGHAAMATATIGTGALLMGRHLDGWRRSTLTVAAGAFILAIAASRIMLGAHTPIEVVIGLAVGLAALGLAMQFLRTTGRSGAALPALPILLAGVILLVHGVHFPGGALARRLADMFALVIGTCAIG